MVEIMPGTAAPTPSAISPPTNVVPPPGLDPAARHERAARATKETSDSKSNEHERVVRDKVEARQLNADAERRQNRRVEQDKTSSAAIEDAQKAEEDHETAKRDKHALDVRI